jgi:CheY-like chemotaxis protein/anti-sigma regulatory factor (Ser/Thr protein kinase)
MSSSSAIRILLVEDNPGDVRLVEEAVKDLAHEVKLTTATNGKAAMDLLKAGDGPLPDLVLTDLQMPGMNGLELVETVRSHFATVPVILMTAFGNEEIALQAIRRGAASYVPKRNLIRDLPETLTQVLEAAQTRLTEGRLFSCLLESESRFVLNNDLALIGPLIGHIHELLDRLKLCDGTGQIRVSVALREALVNAIQHGNLEVGSELRGEDDASYHRLLDERRRQDPYQQRKVHIVAKHSRTQATYTVRDEGPGFDRSLLADPTDPANLENVSGRGLFLIRNFMDEVYHNESGNEITMIKRRDYPTRM